MTVYFNENDPFNAAWLAELFPAAHIDQRAEVLIQWP